MARTPAGFTLTPPQRDLAQIEQLQRPVPAIRSSSASMLTLPQWQLALWVFIAMSVLLVSSARQRKSANVDLLAPFQRQIGQRLADHRREFEAVAGKPRA